MSTATIVGHFISCATWFFLVMGGTIHCFVVWPDRRDKFVRRLPLTFGTRADSSRDNIRVLSWNILAPCYVKNPPPHWLDHPAFDPNWSSWLEWDYRKSRIAQILSESCADVICLQEVQLSLIGDWKVQWDELGYDAYVQETSRGHPVANVILLSRTLPFQVLWQESRSRALILFLVQNTSSDSSWPLFIVNVHLQALGTSENAKTRFTQIASLLKRIHLAWKRFQDDDNEGQDIPQQQQQRRQRQTPLLVVMGDFNLLQSEPLYSFLVQGKWPRQNKDELLYHVDSKLSDSSLAFLPWRDVRQQQQQQQRKNATVSWTFGPTRQVLDYIFVSPSIQSSDDQPQDNKVVVPHHNICFWPNQYHPSDHLPIEATLHFPQ